MTPRRNSFAIPFVLISMLIINYLITLTNIQNADYIICGKTAMTKNTFENVSQTIKSVSNLTPDNAVSKLTAESEKLRKYRIALNLTEKKHPRYNNEGMTSDEAENLLNSYSLTDRQAESRQRIIEFAIERVNYAREYPEYIKNIRINSQNMMSVSIFDSKLKNNILSTEKKYYGFENIAISPEHDAGINILFKDGITDILCVITMLVCAWLYILRCKSTADGKVVEKSRLPALILLVSAAVVLMYAENAVIAERTIGLGNLSRSVQSVWEYVACPYEISTGTFTAVRILFKLSGCLIIFFVSAAFLSSESRLKWCVILLPILAETAFSVFNTEWHIYSLFNAEKIFGQYRNIYIFGESADYSLILTLTTVVLLILSSLWLSRTTSGMLLAEKNAAERKYYDEMTEKYNETRMIRHDMKNHLTAVAMLIDDGKIEDARKYLDDISSEMDKARPPVNTGSLVLDSLLFRKSSDMAKKKIRLNTEFFADFSGNKISEYDLCSIFGNILDNAIEACEKLSPAKRYVNLKVKRQLDMICIICENPYTEINEDLSTQKADKAYHGFGLKRVRKAAKSYSGDVNIRSNDGIFSISVLLNLSSKK